MASNLDISAKLDVPYSGEVDMAKGFTLTINSGSSRTTIALGLSEATTLMRDLVNGLQTYRKAVTDKHGHVLEQAVRELSEV